MPRNRKAKMKKTRGGGPARRGRRMGRATTTHPPPERVAIPAHDAKSTEFVKPLLKAVKAVTVHPLYAKALTPVKPDEKGWFAVKDVKSDPTVDLILSQLSVARATMRGGMKDRPIRVDLSLDCSAPLFTSTVTTGVVAGVTTLLPSAYNEWSSFAALFDEVIVHGSTLEFAYQTGSTNTSISANNMLALVYDPDTAAALSSSTVASQYTEHKLYAIGNLAVSAPDTEFPCGRTMRFQVRIPRGLPYAQYGSSTVVGHVWTPTGNVGNYGYIKSYHASSMTTAAVVSSAINLLHCSFRMRIYFRPGRKPSSRGG